MASVCSLFTISRTQPSFITTSSRLNPNVFQPSLSLRFVNMMRSQVRQKRLITVLASNSNPQGGDLIKETSDRIAEGDTARRGPPLLTILAGIVVFLLVCWIFGSIIIWLFGLIVKVSSSK